MTGVNIFLLARYIVFGLFTICNAITCSVAVWNFSLVTTTEPAKVDVYLIFLGAFSLVLIITLIFVELLCVNAVTTRVWFECVWVALFWVMQLAGATALIAIRSDISCLPNIPFQHALCISERTLLAFSWICSIMLLFYLLLLVSIATSQYHEEPKVWVADVRHLHGMVIRPCTSNLAEKAASGFKDCRGLDCNVPHSQPVQTFPISHPTGLSNYQIEHMPPVTAAPEPMDLPRLSMLREATPLPSSSAGPPSTMPLRKDTSNIRSLSLTDLELPQQLSSSIAYTNPGPNKGPVSGLSCSLPSSLLGDWPRRDVMQLPVKPKRKPPPSAFEFPRAPSEESVHRPVPLNLSGISNYEMGRRDDPG